LTAATNFDPFAGQATYMAVLDAILFETQVVPASLDVKIYPLSADATNLNPSADMARDRHSRFGALVLAQVVPESAEV
jgi:hypothetical protein